jgi:hypothetical protein
MNGFSACGNMPSCNSVANNYADSVNSNHSHVNANSGNWAKYDPLIDFAIPTYSDRSKKIVEFFSKRIRCLF